MKRYLTEDGFEALWRKAKGKGHHRNSDIAEALDMSSRQFQNIIARKASLSQRTIAQLEAIYGFSSDELAALTTAAVPAQSKIIAPYQSLLTSAQRATLHYYKQTMLGPKAFRNIILDSGLSEQLLVGASGAAVSGLDLPSLSDCVTGSRIYVANSIQDRNKPVAMYISYNHFVEVAAVIRFVTPDLGCNHILSYDRRNLTLGHAGGRAIVWGASFAYSNIDVLAPMEKWVQAIRERIQNPDDMFIRGNIPILLQLLSYRIDLLSFPRVKVSPLGIVTLDQREEAGGRVYSQFLFMIDLEVERECLEPHFIKGIQTVALDLKLLPEQDLDKVDYSRPDGEPAYVEQIGVAALKPEKHFFTLGEATKKFKAFFYPGLRLV